MKIALIIKIIIIDLPKTKSNKLKEKLVLLKKNILFF